MPCNLYGPNDNYDTENSHFFPALIKKILHAKIKKKNYINLWGTGKARREIMYVDDAANAIIFFLEKKTKEHLINIGTGVEYSISEYAKIIMKKFGLNLKIKLSGPKLDGTPRKTVDSSIAKNYGWKPKIKLDKGLNYVISDYKKNYITQDD